MDGVPRTRNGGDSSAFACRVNPATPPPKQAAATPLSLVIGGLDTHPRRLGTMLAANECGVTTGGAGAT